MAQFDPLSDGLKADPFAQNREGQLINRKYWDELNDGSLVQAMTEGIGAGLTADQKRVHLQDIGRPHLIKQVVPAEVLPPNLSDTTTSTAVRLAEATAGQKLLAEKSNIPSPGVEHQYIQAIILSPSEHDPFTLVYVPDDAIPERPADLSKFMGEYSGVARTAGILFADDVDQRKILLHRICENAKGVFCRTRFSVVDAEAGLSACRQLVMDSSIIARRKSLREYTRLLYRAGFLPCLVAVMFYKTSELWKDLNPVLYSLTTLIFTGALIAAGATISVWAEFVLRVHEELTYEKVLSLDVGRWRPAERVGIAIVVSFILSFLLAFNVFQVGVGGLLLNDFIKTPMIALAVGGITGLSFTAVRDII
jgi:hypothetical protein